MIDKKRILVSTKLLGEVYIKNDESCCFSVYSGPEFGDTFIGGLWFLVAGETTHFSYGKQFSKEEIDDLKDCIVSSKPLFSKFRSYLKRSLKKEKLAKIRLEEQLENTNKFLKWAETTDWL